MKRIYLDHNAITPVDPEVADEVCRRLREDFGNVGMYHIVTGEKQRSW